MSFVFEPLCGIILTLASFARRLYLLHTGAFYSRRATGWMTQGSLKPLAAFCASKGY